MRVTKITIRERDRVRDRKWGSFKKARVYVFVKELPTGPAPGTDVATFMENRRVQPYKRMREAAVAVLTRLGFPNAKLSWSQHAGCSCPCSPGFIDTEARLPFDAFIDLSLGGFGVEGVDTAPVDGKVELLPAGVLVPAGGIPDEDLFDNVT